MKKMYILNFVLVVCFIFGGMAYAQTNDDVNLHKACRHCGMDRGSFNFSRMLIEYDDGTVNAVCSIHCAATDLANNIDKTPKSIKVGDFNGKQLIDAEKAFWVIGGKKPGVMSKRGKWAFEKKDDAETFMKTNEGKLASFEEAMKAAYEDMYADTKMIREKRKAMRMKMMESKPHTH
jgi:nitrous oxide reductase accessory protein NosL